MGLQARAVEAQVSNTEADTALKIAQAAKEAGEASKKISNYKTSEYLRSGNAGVEDKNSDKQEETNKRPSATNLHRKENRRKSRI